MNLLKKIFSPTILTISFLLLLYTFYKSEIYWHGSKREYYLSYYLFSLLLIFFSIIIFFVSKKIKEYLIISITSVMVSLYIFEGYLVFLVKPERKQLIKEQNYKKQLIKEQIYKEQTEKKWDKRSNFEIYKDLKKVNNKISTFIPTTYLLNENFSFFPLSGISNSETIYCNENGYYALFQSDRYGFRNPDYEWDKKKIEYLLVGDSFSHGACVNKPDDIASILRTLSDKSVLNLGYGSKGPLSEYATLREYLNSKVKKVLWIYYEGNDLEDLVREKNSQTLTNYLNDLTFTQNLKFRQNEINNLLKNITEREKQSNKKSNKKSKIKKKNLKVKIIELIKIYNIRSLIFTAQVSVKSESIASHQNLLSGFLTSGRTAFEFKKILELAKELAIKNNSKIYFIYLPTYNRYTKKFNNVKFNLVKNIITELKIPFIDIHKEVFEKEQNPLKLFPFEQGGHFNVDGYKKVAETIYKLTRD